jgi:hypothetical protein
MDANGKELNTVRVDEGIVEHLTYTTPGAGSYFLAVYDSCAGDKYRLNVTGPLTTGPTPGPAEPTPNGYSSLATAFGPLVGDKLYGGSLDANKEEDWFFFYVAGPGTFDVAFTNIRDASECNPIVRLMDGNGKELNSARTDENEISHLPYAASAAAKFVLRVYDSCAGDKYQFLITPGSLLTSTAPPVALVSRVVSATALTRERNSRTSLFVPWMP